MRTRSNSFHNYWIDQFIAHSGVSASVAAKIKDNTRESVRGFNMIVYRLKEQYGYTKSDLEGLVDYMYYHNPLGLSSKREYGNAVIMFQVAVHYEKWRRAYKDLITPTNVSAVVKDTVPTTEDAEYMRDMKKLYE